ncbi:hypothetical protein Tco_0327111 [Tanacetum coccineum]
MANLEFCDTHNMIDYLKKTEGSEGFHQIVDFLNSSHIRTLDNGEMEITGTIDGKVKIVSEASIMRHLKLEDSDGISNLPTTKIFEQLALMGAKFFRETEVPQPNSPPHTHVADKAASIGVDVKHGGLVTTVTSLDAGQGSGNINKTSSMPHDSPLPRVNTLGSDEGIYGAAYTKLIMKVKKLEKTVKSSQARRRAKIVVSDDEEDLEDPSKQGRKIDEIDQDPDISLVQHDAETQGRYGQEMEFETEAYTAEDVRTARPVSTAGATVTTANVTISTASPPRVSTAEDISTVEILVSIRRSASKDKGKGIMTESEPEQTKTKLQQRQERLGYEAPENIQARVEADEEISARLQAEEQAELTIEERLRLFVELMDKRKKYFAAKRAKEKRNKPLTQAQQRTCMSNYIKHMGKARGTKRAAEEELGQQSSKKQKLDELSQEEIQQLMIIVPEEGMNIEALQTKYPIID